MKKWFSIPLLLLLASAACADTIDGIWANSGEITFRDANSHAIVATISPNIFEPGWVQRRTISASSLSNEAGGMIVTTNGVKITVQSDIRQEGDSIVCRYVLTNQQDLRVNNIDVSMIVPVAGWIGAHCDADGTPATVPVTPAQASIATCRHSLSLTKGTNSLTITTPNNTILLQDNRIWNATDLEIRISTGDPVNYDWKADDPKTIQFTVDFHSNLNLQKERPLMLKPDADWIPMEPRMNIVKGSALDFSFLEDAPAGNHGWVISTPDGFAFSDSPHKTERFYGVNLCFSANYPTKPEARELAQRLAMLGYNAVRIHHYESGLITNDPESSLHINPEQMDKLDYLVYELKLHGIYVTTDLFVSRPIRPDEAPGNTSTIDNFKMAVLVSNRALKNWEDFARELLTHKNPYTGLEWRNDPAIAFISLVNEPNMPANMDVVRGALRPEFEKAWSAWLKIRYPNDAAIQKAWDDPTASLNSPMPSNFDKTPQGLDFAVFAAWLHNRTWERMSAFLRDDLHCKALLTYLNGWAELPQFMVDRMKFDYVDNHFYWDHPRFLDKQWSLPSEGSSGGGSAVDAEGAGPGGIVETRLWNKPFTVTEFNYVAPNPYRAEGGLLIGSFGSLQNWGGVWRFDYASSEQSAISGGPIGYFDTACDPANQAADRAAILLYRREDMKPAYHKITLLRSEKELIQRPVPLKDPGLGGLDLVTGVGTTVYATQNPPKPARNEIMVTDQTLPQIEQMMRAKGFLKPDNKTNLSRQILESDNGEALLEANMGLLEINTPRTAGGVARPGETIRTRMLDAKVEGARAVLWASSLDNKPLDQSSRILLVHVTDVENTDMLFRGQDKRVLEAWGHLPYLVKAGSATVTLRCLHPKGFKAWRLDASGERVAPLPVHIQGDHLMVELSTVGPNDQATLYYEIARK